MPAHGFESEARAAAPPPDLDDDVAAPPALPPDFPPVPVGAAPDVDVGLGPLRFPLRGPSRGEEPRGDRDLMPVDALEETRGFSLLLWEEGAVPKKENRERASSSSLSFASLCTGVSEA
jgi:hypothetical protein